MTRQQIYNTNIQLQSMTEKIVHACHIQNYDYVVRNFTMVTENLMLVLEAEYRNLYARNLTLSRLPEAVVLPLCPDKGACMSYDPNLSASVYVENDLELLMRTNS